MNHKILRSVGILGFSGICAKSFDFAFRAFYSRFLGPEGMGLLSLGFSLHSVMLTVCTAGLGVAVSKVVSEYLEQGRKSDVKKSMHQALWSVAVLGLAVMVAILCFAEKIAVFMLKDERIATGLCCLVPSVLFMGISYCLKGYFYATRKVWIPASSEFLEQVVKFLSISALLWYFLPKGIPLGCAAVFAGISIGECASCLYLTLFYLKDQKGLKGGEERHSFRRLFQVAFPSMVSSLCGSSLRMQEEVRIVAALGGFGMTHSQAVSALGRIYGMVMPMLVFPLTLLGSVTTLLVPEVARRNTLREKESLKRLTDKVHRIGFGIGVGVTAVFMLFAEPLAEGMYRQGDIAPMVRTLSLLCPVMMLDSLSCAMLNGLGRQCSLLIFSVTDSLLRLCAISLFMPRYGTDALLWMIAVSNLFTCALTVFRVQKSLGRTLGKCWGIRKSIFGDL